MAIPKALKALQAEFPAASVIAFADLGSGMILSSATRNKVTQEQLNALCAEASRSFDDPLRGFTEQAVGDPLDAIIIDTSSVRVFARAGTDIADALCCVCDHNIDLDAFVGRLRDTLDAIAAES